MYQTIIFDLDGTLLNTLEDLKDSTNYALSSCELPERTLEEVRTFVGNGVHRLIERAVPEGTKATQIQKVFDVFRAHYLAHCQDKTRPYDGIEEILQYLKEHGFRVAIVSNKSDIAVKELAAHYFNGYIDIAVGEKEGVRRKPAPDTVLEVLRLLETDASEALYVGDSEVDWETAKNAEIDCVAVTWGFRSAEELEKLHPKYLITNPEELIPIVLKIDS